MVGSHPKLKINQVSIQTFEEFPPTQGSCHRCRNSQLKVGHQESDKNFNILREQKILDEDHYGLIEVKERILEFIAIGKFRGSSQDFTASQDKTFVCEEADRAVKALVEAMTLLPLIHKLQGYVNHLNLRIRAKDASAISRCVPRMEIEGLEEFGLVSLSQMAAELLNDRLADAKEAPLGIGSSLYEEITKKEEEKQEAW